jgi:hypothetical protein
LQPEIGWTFLSQKALARAEAQLNPDTQGVRDELGFMTLHRAYADRFFPGTSTQQTRLRYVLFIPWLFRRVAAKDHLSQVQSAIEKEEITLAGRLKSNRQEGIIGGRSYPRAPSQPASLVYWNALGTWNILLGYPDGSYPNLYQVYRQLRHHAQQHRLRDEAGQPLEEPLSIFATLPKPPDNWDKLDTPLDFNLSEHEARFMREKLVGVANLHNGKPSLLARLAQEQLDVSSISWPWAERIMALVDDAEQTTLRHASQAAAMTAIGRAVYAALVEEIRECEDHLATARRHREHLLHVVNTFQKDALALSVTGLCADLKSFPHDLVRLIEQTQSWLAKGDVEHFQQLRPLYASVEQRRKGRRARLLATVAGQERRSEWLPEEHPRAGPLDYRWNVVRRLLCDLRGAQNG